MTVAEVNRLLPAGHFAVFVPAPDETVDDEYAVHNAEGCTGVSVQLAGPHLVVTFYDASDETVSFWPMCSPLSKDHLREFILDALKKGGGR